MRRIKSERAESVERLRDVNIENLLHRRKKIDPYSTDANSESNGLASILLLPYEPVWYIPIIISGAVNSMIVLVESSPMEKKYSADMMPLFYGLDILYGIDVLLMVACKYVNFLSSPVIKSTNRPNYILLLEFVACLPIECSLSRSHNYTLYYTITCRTNENCDTSTERATFLFICIASELTNQGYGRQPYDSVWEIVSAVINFIVFYLVFGLCIGYIINDLTRDLSHKYIFRMNLNIVQLKLTTLKLPKPLVDATIRFYHIYWEKRRGYDDKNSFFQLLPNPMYQQIVLDVCWVPLKHSKLFYNMDLPFLRFISTLIKQRFMLEGEYIYQKNHLKQKMVYVAAGSIQIISEQDGDTPIMTLSAGTCLGESSLILSYKSRNTVRCREYCEVHELHKRDFMESIHKYPAKCGKIREIINGRYREAKKIFTLSKLFNDSSESEGKDYFTITWIKNTLHKLMAKDDDKKSKHENQNIYLRYEMHEHKIHSMLFTAKNLDMLAITERLELDSDSIFLKASWPIVLQPDSLFLNLWEAIIIIITLFSMGIIPFYSWMGEKPSVLVKFSFGFVTAMWWLDFALQLITAVKTRDELVTTYKGIFSYRLHSLGFVLDLLSCIPTQVLSSVLVSTYTDTTDGRLQLNRLLKIWRLFRYFRIKGNRLESKAIFLLYLKFTVVIGYMIFISGVMLYQANCESMDDCYFFHSNYSVFFSATQIVTGVGLQSYWVEQYSNGFIYLVTMTISYLLAMFMLVSFSATFIIQNFFLLKVQMLCQDFEKIIKAKNIKTASKDRIFKYIRTLWMSSTAEVYTTKNKSAISDIPLHLYQVIQEAAFANILKNIPFFSDLDDQILQDICTVVELIVMPPDEIILYTGDMANEILIVHQGYCKIQEKHKTLKEGEALNVMEAFLGIANTQTIISYTHVRLMSIQYSQMKLIYAKFQSYQMEVDRLLTVCKEFTEEVVEQGDIDYNYTFVPQPEVNVNFYKFPKVLEPNSNEEYEYYIPFDRLVLFSFVRIILMKRTIIPTSKFLYIWEWCRSIFAFFSAILFNCHSTGHYDFRHSYWSYVLLFLDLTAVADLYLRLHVCYYDKNGILIVHPWYTAKHYVSHGFLLDLLGVLPLHFLSILGFGSTHRRGALFFQINRVIQFRRYLQLSNLLHQNCVTARTKMYLIGYIPIIIVGIFLFSNIAIGVDCEIDEQIEASENYTKGVRCDEASWFTQSKFPKPISIEMLQLYALYLASTTITAVGSQGFILNNRKIGIITSIYSIIGLIYSVHMCSKVIAYCSASSPTLLEFQENMANLRQFMASKKVPYPLQEQIIVHYEVCWGRDKGNSLPDMLSSFPYSMRQDILYDLYGKALVDCVDFPVVAKHFLREVILNSTHLSITKDGKISSINDINREVYILFSGSVDVIAAGRTRLATLRNGSVFGNVREAKYTRQLVDVVALEHVDLLATDGIVFHSILDKYPALKLYFLRKAMYYLFYVPGKKEEYITPPPVYWRCKFFRRVFNPKQRYVKVLLHASQHLSCYLLLMVEIYQFAVDEFYPVVIFLQYASDVIYFLYLLLKYHMSYEDKRGEMILDVDLVRHHHIHASKYKWRFFVDIISAVPVDAIVLLTSAKHKYRIFKYLRIPKLTRVLNIWEYYAFNKTQLTANHTFHQLVWVLVWMTIMLNFFILVSTVVSCNEPDGFIPPKDCLLYTTSVKKLTGYISHAYVMLNLFTRNAIDKELPVKPISTIMVITIHILMCITTALFFQHIFITIYKSYFTRFRFMRYIEHMNHYFEREEVSKVLVDKTLIYIQRLWMKNKGVMFPKFLSLAPRYLKEGIMNASCGTLLNGHIIFSRCHKDLRKQMVTKLVTNVYYPGDYIAFQEDLNECMFFVHKGEVMAITEDDERKVEIVRTYRVGQTFGLLQGLTSGIPYHHSYKAVHYSVILSLNYKDWKYLLDFFPASKEVIDDALQLMDDPHFKF